MLREAWGEGSRVGSTWDPAAEAATAPEREPAAQGLKFRQRLARRFVQHLVGGAALLLLLHFFVVQISVVRGHSMEPSLWDGDRLLVDRLSYSVMDVARFDMVVLRYPVDPRVDFVKRIVGLPGDRIRIEGGSILVNDTAIPAGFSYVPDRAEMTEILVPEHEYFVLGDNRPISCDSREFGLVPEALLKGKVRARFWPPNRARVF